MSVRNDTERHWSAVYESKRVDEVSWFQTDPATSVELVTRFSRPDQSVVDVGAGASVLVDRLLEAGYGDLCFLDIAAHGLETSRARLRTDTAAVAWVVADLLEWQPTRSFDLWHDRACFHFLIDPDSRTRYRATLLNALPVGGVAILATFAANGPEQCSGLPVSRYSTTDLAAEFSANFTLVEGRTETHTTPTGFAQEFTWVALLRTA